MKRATIVTSIVLVVAPATPFGLASPASAAGTTLNVATNGSDSGSGSASSPFRTVQRAVDAARPGTTILVHKGTYTGQTKISTSGTASSPITLAAAGDGTVSLTSSVSTVSCGSRQPAAQRTIMIGHGADYWTIRGFSINNGVYIMGDQGNRAYQYLTNFVKSKNWQARRAIPGRGTNDPAAARSNLLTYLRSKTVASLDPSDGIKIIGNTITGRGIHAAFSRYGAVTGNTITSINCGTGPAVWLITFADGWDIGGNSVSKVARSTAAHFMQEGIRLGSASNYNSVHDNTVQDLDGDGRAFNTDVDSSFNTFQNNIARRVAIGYNDQMSGWGNRWVKNRVESYRTYGFGFRLMDGKLTRPSSDTSTNGAVVTCNVAASAAGGTALGMGASMKSTFTGNVFPTATISRNLQSYWGREGNRWNGSATAPDRTPSGTAASC